MNATGKRRLLKLADFLASLKLKRGQFDMRKWAHEVVDGRPKCGTAACAAGWASAIPSFRRAGYRLIRNRNYSIGNIFGQAFLPAIGRKRGDDALRHFFDISGQECIELFGSHNPNGAKDAVRRIRSLVKND